MTSMASASRARLLSRSRGSESARTVLSIYGVLFVLVAGAPLVSNALTPLPLAKTVLSLAVFVAVVAFGQFLVVLIGGLDLSIPSVMTLAGVVLTTVSANGDLPQWTVPILVVAIGFIVGLANGVGVVWLKISPVVMTLATNVIVGGVVLVYTNGTPTGEAPPFLVKVTQGATLAGLPRISLVFAVFVVIAVVVMRWTVFGRRVYAVGSNSTVAYLSGVGVNLLTLGVYGISAAMAAISGILLVGSSGSSYLGLGDPYLLLSLTAVIVGGVSVSGGRGAYVGVVGGALILMTISVILSATSWPQSSRQMIYAVVIIASVILGKRANEYER